MDFLHDLPTVQFFAFLAVMSPLANAPVFIGLTSEVPAEMRRAIAIRATLAATAVVAVFGLAGPMILHAFDITIPAVRAFGGLVVTYVAFELISKSSSAAHRPGGGSSSEGLGIAISPLAIPILAGPGTLATALGFTVGVHFTDKLATLAAFVVVAALNLISFLVAEQLVRRLGEELIAATTKVMGVILGAIGIQMAISGILAVAKS